MEKWDKLSDDEKKRMFVQYFYGAYDYMDEKDLKMMMDMFMDARNNADKKRDECAIERGKAPKEK